MGWVLPTDFNDPDIQWNNEALAYDDDTETFSDCSSDAAKLELILDTPISCDKIRFYISSLFGVGTHTISVFYGGEYHQIYAATPAKDDYIEVEIGSTETVSKAEINGATVPGNRNHKLHEFQFNEAAAPPPALPYTSVNIGDEWKTISGSNVIKAQVGGAWKNVTAVKAQVGGAWKDVTIV